MVIIMVVLGSVSGYGHGVEGGREASVPVLRIWPSGANFQVQDNEDTSSQIRASNFSWSECR